ncbi:MAG: esterase-like activity of phytase family protein [Alloprevotella sp.]|nr:esterase-like activity of phytase family protein [Alloprevotella sp.]
MLVAYGLHAQSAVILKQQKLKRWNIPAANYSGITHVRGNVYALVSDKPRKADGASRLLFFSIEQDTLTGRIVRVEEVAWSDVLTDTTSAASPSSLEAFAKDAEGVCFYPERQTFFVTDEADQSIREFFANSEPTGRRLAVPAQFARDSIRSNRGFEALCYDASRHQFWTSTESPRPSDEPLTLRLQSFDESLEPALQYLYTLDAPELKAGGRFTAHGASGLCALPSGKLVVLERELRIPKGYLGGRCVCKLYEIDPQSQAMTLNKKLICQFQTRLRLFSTAYANYEGLCPGIRLSDGRQTLLLVADSQNGAGKGPFHLRDYVRVVVLPAEE